MLSVDGSLVQMVLEGPAVRITSTVKTHGQTGVEMEALNAVMGSALCIYDMCKALSHDIAITDIRLLHKAGGKSDFGQSATTLDTSSSSELS